ncbi:unnamed protein product [Pylaiella littoralis]
MRSLSDASYKRRGGGGGSTSPSMLLSPVLVLLALIDQSTAFVAIGSAVKSLTSRCGAGAGAISSLGSRAGAGVVVPLVAGARGLQQQRRWRVQQLGMAIDTSNNPITSKVYGRADTKATKTPEMNEEIAASGIEEVRCVISIKGMDEQLGIMPTQQALQRASDENLDLVMINKEADPPVVKIIDYGKFKYKQDRRKKDNKAKHKATELKEVKMSYKIETHDYEVRLRNAKKFLNQGNRVRIVVTFRGREQAHMDLGNVLLAKVTQDLDGLALVEPRRREGSRLSMIVFPKPTT